MKDQTTTPSSGAWRRKRYRRSAAVPDVQSITNAAEAHSREMHERLVKYSIAMGIRMVCIALIFVFDGWYRLVPVVGAVVLPWVAVVIANGGADTNRLETATLLEEEPLYEIAEGPPDEDSPVVLEGELVDNEADRAAPGAAGGKGAGGGTASGTAAPGNGGSEEEQQ